MTGHTIHDYLDDNMDDDDTHTPSQASPNNSIILNLLLH